MARARNTRRAARNTTRYAPRGVLRGRLAAVLKLSVLGALLFYGGLAFSRYVQYNELYLVKSIRIEGLKNLEGKTILTGAGITNRTNLLLMFENKVAARVESLAGVRRCEVERVFPGQVIIKIDEREPFATLLANNRAFIIDREGVVMEEKDLIQPHVEPYITEVSGLGVLRPGQQIEIPALHAAMAMLDAFRKSEVARKVTVSEVAAHSITDLRMYCDELPFEVRWGRGDYETQARRFDVLWAYCDGDFPFKEYCELRYGPMIACK